MILKKWLKKDDYQTYFAVAQMFLCMGSLGLVFGASRLLDIVITDGSWLDFLKGLFIGISFSLIVLSLVLNIQGLRKKRFTKDTAGV